MNSEQALYEMMTAATDYNNRMSREGFTRALKAHDKMVRGLALEDAADVIGRYTGSKLIIRDVLALKETYDG